MQVLQTDPVTVVSALIDLGVEIADVVAALTLEDAFEQLQDISSIQDESEDYEDADQVTIEDDEWVKDCEER